MRRLIFFLAFLATYAGSSAQEKENGWIQLFNGKDIENWTIKITGSDLGVNYKNTFRVEDGMLRVKYDEYDHFDGEYGHIFYKHPYSHYKLRIEYRFTGEQVAGGEGWALRNSGVMLHGQTPESMEKDQQFPTSIEVQFLGGNGTDERTTLNLCTPGTNVVMNGQLITDHCTNSTSKTYHGDQWVTAEIEVCGDSIIKHIIGGQVVLQYNQPQLDERDPTYNKLLPAGGNKLLKSGTISLQAESHPVDFRKVELLNLGEECD